MREVVLQMNSISKRFPGVQALDNAIIEVERGEVHALAGENGAGKSTLMKILNGLIQPDAGVILISGEVVRIKNPAHAKQLGIAMIYQELNPVRYLSVADNLFLGRELMQGKSVLLDKKAQNQQAQVMIDDFGLKVKATDLMKDLSIGQIQMVEILKAVSSGAKLIVMDEPTSSLADEEIKALFAKIAELKLAQVSIVYITHRLEEIFKIADRITVLRDGHYIGTSEVSKLSMGEIIQMMVGRQLNSIYPPKSSEVGARVLEVSHLSGEGFDDVSFHVCEGEILGFYGLVGAGRSEVVRAVFGLDSHSNGDIHLQGECLKINHPSDAISAGIVMVPEDRKELGLVLCRSILENIALPNLKMFSNKLVVNQKKEKLECGEIAEKIRVKMSSLNQLTGNLSGGNQQKVVLSKWLLRKPKVLILDEPTRGIDVGAKAEIHELMRKLANEGLAIIMISSELPEILGMSDRVIVMGDGVVRKEYFGDTATQNQILQSALEG